jgi:hypothetical protein
LKEIRNKDEAVIDEEENDIIDERDDTDDTDIVQADNSISN